MRTLAWMAARARARQSGGLILAPSQRLHDRYVAKPCSRGRTLLHELSIDMFPRRCLHVYGVGDDGVTAFTGTASSACQHHRRRKSRWETHRRRSKPTNRRPAVLTDANLAGWGSYIRARGTLTGHPPYAKPHRNRGQYRALATILDARERVSVPRCGNRCSRLYPDSLVMAALAKLRFAYPGSRPSRSSCDAAIRRCPVPRWLGSSASLRMRPDR